MSGYESPSPEDEVVGKNVGGATGGGSPGNPDDMGADEELTVEEGAGRPKSADDNPDGNTDVRDEPTHDEQVRETGDEHFGLEGGVDIRPPSAREDLRLT